MNHGYMTDALYNLSRFARRVTEQLNAKKQNVRTLTDAENLLIEEQKSCTVIKASIFRLSDFEQQACIAIALDLAAIATDYEIVEKHRKHFREERVANPVNLDKIEKFEATLKPRPNLRVLQVYIYTDDSWVETNEQHHEIQYRHTQAKQYFLRLIQQHCDLNDPTGYRGEARDCQVNGKQLHFTPSPMGYLRLPIAILNRDRIPTRCASRDFIFNPERSYHQEYERIIRQFIEESCADPANFKLAELLTVLPPDAPQPQPDSADPNID